MDNSLEYKSTVLKPISSVEQLVASHLVADIIIDIRENLEKQNQSMLEFMIPPLEGEASERIQALYARGSKIFKFKPQYVYMLKIGLEDISIYDFGDDPSVVTAGTGDTTHLQQIFGARFTELRGVNLADHTLNVLEEALDMAEKSGRPSGLSIGILGALFHDFGKSTKIREQIIGKGMQRGYKSHAEVSQMYIQDLLINKLYNTLKEGFVEVDIIDSLAHIVKNHHPANAKLKADLDINFVLKSDQEARKKEFRSLNGR